MCDHSSLYLGIFWTTARWWSPKKALLLGSMGEAMVRVQGF